MSTSRRRVRCVQSGAWARTAMPPISRRRMPSRSAAATIRSASASGSSSVRGLGLHGGRSIGAAESCEKRLHPVNAAAKMALDDALRDRRLVDQEGPLSLRRARIRRMARAHRQRDARTTRAPERGGALDHDPHAAPALTLGAALVFVAAACSQAPGAPRPLRRAGAGGNYELRRRTPTLLAAAKTEGTLTTIALPHDWCNYGEVIDDASRPRPASPSTSSARTPAPATRSRRSRPTRTTTGPQAPDVIDVGLVVRPVGQDRRACPALQGRDLGHDPGRRQGRGRLLVRRLLRRPLVRGQQDRRQPNVPEGLGRPAQARVQGQGRPRRRSRVNSSQAIHAVYAAAPRQRRLARRRDAGPRLLQAAQRQRATSSRRHRLREGTVANGETPITITLDLQRACRA